MSSPISGKNEGKPRWNKAGETRFPPAPSCSYILEWLFELGPMCSNGFGVDGVSWTEIDSWSRLSQRRLTQFEAKALHVLSSEYAMSFEAGKEKSCPPPYQPDTDEARKVVSDTLKTILNSMIAKQKQQKKKHG